MKINMRFSAFLVAFLGSILLIAVVSHFTIPEDKSRQSFAAELLFGWQSTKQPETAEGTPAASEEKAEWFAHPTSIQNIMWIMFFVGIGELVVRIIAGSGEIKQLRENLLSEHDGSVLYRIKNSDSSPRNNDPQDVGNILRKVRRSDPDGRFWLQSALSRSILAFQTSGGSVEQVSAVFNSTLELFQHEAELRYNMIRYLAWLIPTLGFIGTVLGIALALRNAGVTFAEFGADGSTDLAEFAPKLMSSLTGHLGVAFYTTLLALLQSAVLMFTMHISQSREEGAINHIGQYCLDHLIIRLYEKK